MYDLQKLFCTLAFEVTESDLHQQEVQIRSFQNMSGIFQIPSSFETTRCQKLPNDFPALPQLHLAIKDGPGHIQKIWDTLSKLQVCPGHAQIFEPFDWLKGYKIAFSVPHGFVSPEKNGFSVKVLVKYTTGPYKPH